MRNANSKSDRASRKFPALIAVGGSLAALPAAALELGDLTVQSRLGQPLRASIAFALAPNEQISDVCVSLRSGATLSGLPNVGPASLSLTDGVIRLTGNTAIREPMVAAHIKVNCPYAANISREYMLFIDPATPAYQASAITQPAPAKAVVETVAPPATRTRTVARPKTVAKDISIDTRYQVRAGDSLSEISERIENRPIGLWPMVNAIFDANPDAFVDSDPNKLKTGSWLSIPGVDGRAAVVSTDTTTTTTNTEAEPVSSSTVEQVADAGAAVSEMAADIEATDVVIEPDVVVDDNLFVESTGTTESILIPDTQLEGPTTTSVSPNVPTATAVARPVAEPMTDGNKSNWPMWFTAGSGMAMIIGLLLFGRRLRGRLSPAPLSAAADPQMRRSTDDDGQRSAETAVDYDLTDESPTEENLALDADLFIGTGLERGTEMDSPEEFGFAHDNDMNIELPIDPNVVVDLREKSILDSEVLPDDDNYDMSVIMDATKMPQPEDVTKYDIKAVAIDSDESMITDSYTINKESDFEILEQDYEEEMTATQALNVELMRAAANAEDTDNLLVGDVDMTAPPLASVVEIDSTAQMPLLGTESGDAAETPVDDVITVNISETEKTAEMPVATNDEDTVDMPAKSGNAS